MTTKPEFNYVTIIKAPIEKVWQAMVDPAFTKRYWFESEVKSDWQIGSNYSFFTPDGREALRGEIFTFDKPNELVYQFTCPMNDEIKHENSTVQFLLEKLGDATKLTVRHYDFAADSKMVGFVTEGWPIVLSGLKTLLETDEELVLPKEDK